MCRFLNRNPLVLIIGVLCTGRLLSADQCARDRAAGIPDTFYYVTGSHPEWYEATKLFSLFVGDRFSEATPLGETLSIPYRLFTPRFRFANGKYPLVVWVHGYGADEKDLPNTGQLKHLQLVFRDLDHPEKYPFYLLAPQNVDSPSWFNRPGTESTSSADRFPGDLVLDLIDDVIAKNPIDPNRVTLVGISSGATVSWEFAARRPNLFAGMLLFSSAGAELGQLRKLTNISIWAFHSADDSPEGDRRTISELTTLGGCCRLTELPGKEHNCWYRAFRDYNPFDWLLVQRKGGKCNLPPERAITVAITQLGNSLWFWTIAITTLVTAVLIVSRRMLCRGRISTTNR